MKGRLLLHAHDTRLRESTQSRHRGFWLTGARLLGILDQSKYARIIERLRYLQRGMGSTRGPDCPMSAALQSTVEARTIVRRLWRAAEHVVGVVASVSGLAWVAFVAGGFVWGIAKGITGTMRDPSGWNDWLSIVGGGVLILFGLIIVLRAIGELLKYIFFLPRGRSNKPTWGWCTFLLFGLVLLVGGAFCITDAPVFKLPLVVVSVGMMLTLFLEGREEAKFAKALLEAEARARQQAPTTLVT